MRKILLLCLLSTLFVAATFAQKPKPKPKQTPKQTIFAVLNDGKTLEPIVYVERGKLVQIGDGSTGEMNADFVKAHYKPKTKYNLIFGGKNVGSATVIKDLSDTECAANQAQISVYSKRVKPKGFLMTLATNAYPKKNVLGTRQLPTSIERREIETLVMAEMKNKKVPIKNIGELRYHNLTKIDVDNDKNPEFVGTYWYNTGAKKRSLLFFIAEKDKTGTITLPFSKFEEYDESKVMSGEIKSLDDGIYHELLLDLFDYDSDGQSEIFTISQAFEGSNFNAYKRVDGKWTEVLDTSNYHCGY